MEQGKDTLTESGCFVSNHASSHVLPCFPGFSLVSFVIHLCLAEMKGIRLQEDKYNLLSQSYLILKATARLTAAPAEVI